MENVPVEKKYVPVTSYGPRIRIAKLYDNPDEFMYKIIKVAGWARTTRAGGKDFCFIELNDGSTLKGLQVLNTHLNSSLITTAIGCRFQRH